MSNKIRKEIPYPDGLNPDYINPTNCECHRFLIGKSGNNPLVALCMNPSKATLDFGDKTVVRIAKVSNLLSYDGWCVINTYPKYATTATSQNLSYDNELICQNVEIIRQYLEDNNIKEIWCAWGDKNLKALKKGRIEILKVLNDMKISAYHFDELTKKGNPRHPMPRTGELDYTKKISFDIEKYLDRYTKGKKK